jgi:hypothetical protein
MVTRLTLPPNSNSTYRSIRSFAHRDACLIPQLYNSRRFDVDLSLYPCLLKIEETCLKEEAFIEAQPDMQEDCPEADRNKIFGKGGDDEEEEEADEVKAPASKKAKKAQSKK